MAKVNIHWTLTALRQRNKIFEYWNERNKSNTYSIKLNYKIKDRINQLKVFPESGIKTDFADNRLISLGHYSILYKKIENSIIITAIWDNRQDTKKLLDLLKNDISPKG